jgi:hypothetical protein
MADRYSLTTGSPLGLDFELHRQELLDQAHVGLGVVAGGPSMGNPNIS